LEDWRRLGAIVRAVGGEDGARAGALE
jgi:hypothetical protein